MDRNILVDESFYDNKIDPNNISHNLKTINAITILKNCKDVNENLKSVSDNIKRKIIKTINSQFECSQKQFISIVWAYLDLNCTKDDDPHREANFLESFRLLFSKYNNKHELFDLHIKNQGCNHGRIKRKKDRVNESAEVTTVDDESVDIKDDNSDTQTTESIGEVYPILSDSVSVDDDGDQLNGEDDDNATLDNHDTNKVNMMLKNMCESFFREHGLTVKMRKLPDDYNNNKKRIKTNYTQYPSYHFISRQRKHIFEQIMRCRTFLDTRFNSCNEMRNSKSPFSLFELHPNILNYFKELKDDIDDPEFSGVYISLSTVVYTTSSELGVVSRTKTVAWCLLELTTNNERCLKCLWIHPSLSATACTNLLLSFLPYVILTSFSISPSTVDVRYSTKLFYVWLNDFDTFPRQALILLTSMKRFGLIKHYDHSDDSIKNVSHADAGTQDDECYCYAKANWDDIDQIIVGCTEQLMLNLIPKWIKLIKQNCDHLREDLLKLISNKHNIKSKESRNDIKYAEFTGLEHTEIRDLLMYLYGNRWKFRLKIKNMKLSGTNVDSYLMRDEYVTSSNERENRRKRREMQASQ